LRALEADRLHGSAGVVAVLFCIVGLAVWWAFAARITLYEVSRQARIEAGQASYSIQSPASAQVVRNHLVVGRFVEQGEVLLELESHPDRLELEVHRTELAVIEPRIAVLRRQIDAEKRALSEEHASTQAAIEENRRRIRESELAAQHSDSEERRLRVLFEQGLLPPRDFEAAVTETRLRRAAVETGEAISERLRREQQARDRERDVRVEKIAADILELESLHRTAAAKILPREYAVERRKIRAPVNGRIAEAMVLRAGSVVREGEQLASIVPSDSLTLVAQYSSADAMGRIQPGQPARMRLEGFPWTEYGSVPGRVVRVAGEVRQGTVRVDLSLEEGSSGRLPLSHGMPGTLEIEVERLSPAALLLRVAGQAIAAPRMAEP
jgi:multidrug resistance efflux pump